MKGMKTQIKFFIVLSILLIFYNRNYSQSKTELLSGKWELEKRQSSTDIDETILGEKGNAKSLTLSFFKNGTGYDHGSEIQFKYHLIDDILIIGDRSYKLIRLTKDKLILEEEETLLSLSTEKLIFTKVED